MKTLLVAINAKYIHSNLAIYSLRAYASKQGHEVDIAEYTINQQIDSILRDIYERKPELVGFSCYIWNIEYVKKIVIELKKILPSCRIWLGGPEVSYDCEEVVKQLPVIDGIIIGEGEITFSNLIEAIKEDKGISDISGIAWVNKEDRSVRIIPPQGYVDMDSLPFPYRDLKEMDNRIIYYESSRGCPYSCSYCLSSVDKKVRYRDLKLVKKELGVFIKAKVPQVKFVDRTFNCNRERTLAIWKYILKNDNGITNFHFEISADIITDEEIKLLKKMRPGLVQLEIGVQTTNEKTLKEIRRYTDFDKLSGIVNKIKEAENVHQHLDLIAGLPYEDYESFAKSFNDVYSLEPQQLQLGFLKVLKGSNMQEVAIRENIQYTEYPPYEVLSTPWLSFEDVLKLKGVEEMVEVYYNSGQFTATLAYISRFFTTPFEMFEYLAQYYKDNNLQDIGHSRIRRYEVLLDAIEDKYSILKEVLTYDLYLRENLKSRPQFLTDISEYKEAIHSFYLDEDNVREALPGYDMYNTKQIERMTNVEYFSIDVDELIKTGEIVHKDKFILFDYANVNKVNQAAMTIDVTDVVGKKLRVKKVLELLDERYTKEYKCYLNHENPWQLLIATILSAQCTDERVNMITKDLFAKYTSLLSFANADLEELKVDIHSAGFYHNKAVNIIACAKKIVEDYGGEVPSDIDKLTSLAGVGRKTANVIRGNIFNIPSIVVDTHVKRISNRLGFVSEEDPVKIEYELMKVLPKDHWILFNIHIITLGRTICMARKPECENCFLNRWCPKVDVKNT